MVVLAPTTGSLRASRACVISPIFSLAFWYFYPGRKSFEKHFYFEACQFLNIKITIAVHTRVSQRIQTCLKRWQHQHSPAWGSKTSWEHIFEAVSRPSTAREAWSLCLRLPVFYESHLTTWNSVECSISNKANNCRPTRTDHHLGWGWGMTFRF